MKRLGPKIDAPNLKSINDNMRISIYLLISLGGISSLTQLEAVRPAHYYDSQQSIAFNETRDTVDCLRHQVENQETEMRTFEQKLDNFHSILDTLREQIEETTAAHKEQLKGNSTSLEMKISSLENSAKSLTADIKQLQTHANETTTALQLFKQKLSDWDQRIQSQNKNIENLQAALQTLMDAFQMKTEPAGQNATGKTHKVQSGDSLEKIAKTYGTTVQAIKELNGITSDKIVVGKTIKLP